MAKRTIEEAAEIAASWWMEKIVNPKFDMGSSSTAESLAEILALAASENVAVVNALKFKDILKAKIIDTLNTRTRMTIDVDYDPCKLLYEAMTEAGISSSNAPWKTCMWIDNKGSISVKYGYGADTVDL